MEIKLKPIIEAIAADNKKLALVVLFTFVLVYVDYSLFLRAQIQKLNMLNSKISSTKKDINKLQQDMSSMKDIKQGQEIRGAQSAKAIRIISVNEIPELLKEISDMANKNQVRINQIRPSREAKDTKNALAQKFDSVIIALDLSGEYHKVGVFINDLENADVFLSVEEIRVVSNAKDFFHQDVKLTLKTYVKN